MCPTLYTHQPPAYRWVRKEIAEEVLVMEEPREKACVVRTLKASDQVAIFAEQVRAGSDSTLTRARHC